MNPLAWISQDAFARFLGGETVCQPMTPERAMYDDVPLTVVPPGYALVRVSLLKEIMQSLDGTPMSMRSRGDARIAKDVAALITAAKEE